MDVWVCSVGEPLTTDPNNPRLMRCGILCEELVAKGHSVTLWSSSFDHAKRNLRVDKTTEVKVNDNYSIVILHGGSYKKNISLARLINHKKIGEEFNRLAPQKTKPDVIIASMPIIDLPLAATHFGKLNNIPTIVDIRDLWPSVFIDVFPKGFKWLAKLATIHMSRDLRKLCTNATAITGNSPMFVNWGVSMADRSPTSLDKDFPFGYKQPEITNENQDESTAFWAGQAIDLENDFICCFFGTIGKFFDFKTIIDAANILHAKAPFVKFVMCGDGTNRNQLKNETKKLANIIWPGRINKYHIWHLMQHSKIGMAPYVNIENFLLNLPNKPAEYFCGGLPVASSIEGYLGSILKKHNCGFVYTTGNDLATKIIDMKQDVKKLKTQSKAARELYLRSFQADIIYNNFVDHIELVTNLSKK